MSRQCRHTTTHQVQRRFIRRQQRDDAQDARNPRDSQSRAADEYDTAFFDKRCKFIHTRARTAIVSNLELDYADIFSNKRAGQDTPFNVTFNSVDKGVARRMENKDEIGGFTSDDDLAHHPAAIHATLVD